jgi:hypothetical protein
VAGIDIDRWTIPLVFSSHLYSPLASLSERERDSSVCMKRHQAFALPPVASADNVESAGLYHLGGFDAGEVRAVIEPAEERLCNLKRVETRVRSRLPPGGPHVDPWLTLG